MRKHALKPVWKRKFTHTTDSRHGLPVFGYVLDRRFKADRPNRAWVSDITYIPPVAAGCTLLPNWCARRCAWLSANAARNPA